jgi:phosphatidylglycerophosphatase C
MIDAGSPVAVFDLDGTVTCRDTYLAYLMYVLRRRSRRLPYCFGLPAAVLQFKRGRLSNETLKCRFLAAILGGCSRPEIERHTAGFVEVCVTAMVKPAARARIARHRREGHRLVLASASLDVYATALGTRLGFDDVLCTRVAWVADAIGSSLAGPNLLGEAKLAAVKEALAIGESSHELTFAYSDHHTDLPLLLFAKHGVAVDPTPRLAAAAAAYGLRVENWRG